MTADWRREPLPRGYVVTQVERDRTGHHALTSMAGPEFSGLGAVYAPLGALPIGLRLAAVALLLLIGMAGCTAAWIDYQDYTPSPNICRQDEAARAAELGCIRSQQVPAGRSR